MGRKWSFAALLLSAALALPAVAACGALAGGTTAVGEGKKLLYIKQNEGSTDLLLINRLRQMGFTVFDMAEPSVSQLGIFDLVYVSDTASISRFDPQIESAAVPVIYAKSHAAFIAGLSTDYGSVKNTKSIKIQNSRHKIAAGLKGTVAVYRENGTFGFGEPGKEAIVVATAENDDRKATVFAYERGAKNAKNATVPERRVFFFLAANQQSNMTDDGWKLFEAALRWALHQS